MRIVFQTLALLIAVVLVGSASLYFLRRDIPDYPVPAVNWETSGLLDGMTFFTNDTVVESGDQIMDALRFSNGGFQSAMCQVYCDFGWHPYQTFVDGDVIHWTATTRCPDAPHTVVFYGTITDNTVQFEGTWTTRRWYWTHQVNVVGAGSDLPTDAHIAEGILQ